MKYFTPFRIATYLLLLLTAGHTFGGMLGDLNFGGASDAVLMAMKTIHFDFGGSDATWYNFWFGFGIVISGFLLMSAVIAWQLDKIEAKNWASVKLIAWALIAAQAWNAILSFKYFFAGPGVLATLATLALAYGAMKKENAAAVPTAETTR